MVYVMLLNLQIVHLVICPIVENFKKLFIPCFPIGSIVVYCTTIILNILNKVAYCMELGIV